MDEELNRIPEERRDRVRAALGEICGPQPIAGLEPVVGGASGALLYRVDVHGRRYLLRLEMRRTPLRNPHQYVCMQTAADAGIAPPLRYVDAEDGIAIMDFVAQRPLAEYPGGPLTLARDLGALAARLQATPRFPELRDYPVLLDRMLAFVRGSGLFAPGLLDPHLEGFQRIRAAYPWDSASLVSSHNDPNPRNILFDGERLWLVDWETAYRNDPLTDVAILVENLAPTPSLEEALLVAWHGSALDRVLRARLTLMRQLTRVYYACLLFGISGRIGQAAQPDTDLSAPTPAEFGAAVASGRLKATSPETIYTLGKMCLAGFLGGLSAPGFEEALIVAANG